MAKVTIYTKLGCHLCEVVEATIAEVAKRKPFELVRHDIAEDPSLFDLYRHDVPVVFVNDEEIARHRMTAAELIAALQ
jgi:glutaredoxin